MHPAGMKKRRGKSPSAVIDPWTIGLTTKGQGQAKMFRLHVSTLCVKHYRYAKRLEYIHGKTDTVTIPQLTISIGRSLAVAAIAAFAGSRLPRVRVV